MLASVSIPFFSVTSISRVSTRPYSFIHPSILLIVQTCVYCFIALSPTSPAALEVSPRSESLNVLANIPDLYATSSTPVSTSGDLVSYGELPLSPRSDSHCLQLGIQLHHYKTFSTSSPDTTTKFTHILQPSPHLFIQWYSGTSGSIRTLLRTLHMDNNP
jgi:hypothetical protein